MQESTGEIKTLEEIEKLNKDEQAKYVPIPTKHHAAALRARAEKRPGWRATDKELNVWAKGVKRKTKAKRKQRKASKKRNR